MGLVRDRTFARTFGAGTELDAYNAAFVLPGARARRPRGRRPGGPVRARSSRASGATTATRPADDFGRTVLTVAVLVMAIAVVVLFVVAPATVDFDRARLRRRRRARSTSTCSG